MKPLSGVPWRGAWTDFAITPAACRQEGTQDACIDPNASSNCPPYTPLHLKKQPLLLKNASFSSVRLGNNRFGQPGAWQVSFFRDTIAPHSGVGGGGGYANNAIGTASSAPVFSTASPAGTPRCVRACVLAALPYDTIFRGNFLRIKGAHTQPE